MTRTDKSHLTWVGQTRQASIWVKNFEEEICPIYFGLQDKPSSGAKTKLNYIKNIVKNKSFKIKGKKPITIGILDNHQLSASFVAFITWICCIFQDEECLPGLSDWDRSTFTRHRCRVNVAQVTFAAYEFHDWKANVVDSMSRLLRDTCIPYIS